MAIRRRTERDLPGEADATEPTAGGTPNAEQVSDLLAEMTRMDGFLRALNDSHGARLAELETQVSQLRRRVSQLERERIGTPAAPITGSTVLHDEYRAIGERVEALLDQYVMHLATPANAASGQAPFRLVAQSARRICDALFATDGVDQKGAMATVAAIAATDNERLALVATVADEITRLRADARAKGLAHSWLFTSQVGGSLDELRQRPLGSCDPAGNVELVVFPAFLVDDTVVTRQRVYTSQ
jgi:hypothetical protein